MIRMVHIIVLLAAGMAWAGPRWIELPEETPLDVNSSGQVPVDQAGYVLLWEQGQGISDVVGPARGLALTGRGQVLFETPAGDRYRWGPLFRLPEGNYLTPMPPGTVAIGAHQVVSHQDLGNGPIIALVEDGGQYYLWADSGHPCVEQVRQGTIAVRPEHITAANWWGEVVTQMAGSDSLLIFSYWLDLIIPSPAAGSYPVPVAINDGGKVLAECEGSYYLWRPEVQNWEALSGAYVDLSERWLLASYAGAAFMESIENGRLVPLGPGAALRCSDTAALCLRPGGWGLVVPSAADFDLDWDVDLVDFATFAECFGSGPVAEECVGCDLDPDGIIDFADFATFSSEFGT